MAFKIEGWGQWKIGIEIQIEIDTGIGVPSIGDTNGMARLEAHPEVHLGMRAKIATTARAGVADRSPVRVEPGM
jgi:hypothetical protein